VSTSTSTALVIVKLRLRENRSPVPRCADILRCLHCGSTWSLLMDGVVSPSCVTMTIAPVPPDRVGEIGAGVAWFGCDDCELCAKDRVEPDWDELRASIETLPDPQLRVALGQMIEDRRRRFR
jgi:hypothetical protein